MALSRPDNLTRTDFELTGETTSGAQITWLSRHLGHSSLKVTTDIYGHWERAERKLQAAKMEGVFPV